MPSWIVKYEEQGVPVRRLMLFGVVVLVSFAGLHHLVSHVVVESLMLATLLYALAGFESLRERLRAVPATYRHLTVALVLLFAVGQIIKASEYTFPLVGWSMYGVVHEEDPVFYEYEAIHRSGQQSTFIPADIIPTLANSRLDNKLKRQIGPLLEAEEDLSERRALHEATLRALALRSNQTDTDPIVAIDVYRGTVPLDAYQGAASLKKEKLWRVAIPASE